MVTDDLAAILVTAGVGVLGSTIFAGGLGLPDLPNGDPSGGIVAVGDPYGGLDSVRVMGSGPSAPALERPRVQVLARGATYVEARTKALAALAALDWYGPGDVDGRHYENIEAVQRPPFLLEVDQNGRFVFAFNAAITRAGV